MKTFVSPKSNTLEDIFMIDISAVSKKMVVRKYGAFFKNAPNFAKRIELGIFHFEIVEQTETINSRIITTNIT